MKVEHWGKVYDVPDAMKGGEMMLRTRYRTAAEGIADVLFILPPTDRRTMDLLQRAFLLCELKRRELEPEDPCLPGM